jgi:nucleoside-triphosphatase THEP1
MKRKILIILIILFFCVSFGFSITLDLKTKYFEKLKLIGIVGAEPFYAEGDSFKKCDECSRVKLFEKNEHTFIKLGQEVIKLYPLLVLKVDKDGEKRFYFYNDLRKAYVSILNYEYALHQKDRELKEIFLKEFPLEKWRSEGVKVDDRFKERIELLTETFKGRKDELTRILKFISHNRGGYLMLWGGPGVGKSALLARIVQILSWSSEVKKEAGFEIDNNDQKISVIEYFIRRDMGTNKASEFLDYMYRVIESRYKLGFKGGINVREKRNILIEQLRKISKEKLKNDEKLVLIIDGIDEGSEDKELLESLPKEYIDKIITIYSSRENYEVRNYVYDNLEREKHEELYIKGLSIEDTRALLYEYINKYELKKEFVEGLRKKSEGNPLFIKLVCQGLEDGIYKLNDTISIPDKLSEVYGKIIKNFYKIDREGDFFEILMILAGGKDFFSVKMLAEITGYDTLRVKRAIDILIEVLVENPLTENVFDYQLFHESLREYLKKTYPEDLRKAGEKICEWIKKWENLTNESRYYALKYFFNHFGELYFYYKNVPGKNAEEIYKLMVEEIERKEFRTNTFEVCGNDISLRYGFRLLQKIILERDKEGREMERFFAYARMINTERERIIKELLQKLIDESKDGNLENIIKYAMIGTNIKGKLLLIIRALWESPTSVKLPSELIKKAKEWSEELSEPIMEKLLEKSFERFK